jgi:hypothetical protein
LLFPDGISLEVYEDEDEEEKHRHVQAVVDVLHVFYFLSFEAHVLHLDLVVVKLDGLSAIASYFVALLTPNNLRGADDFVVGTLDAVVATDLRLGHDEQNVPVLVAFVVSAEVAFDVGRDGVRDRQNHIFGF